MGRQKKQLQPDELFRTYQYLKNRINEKWIIGMDQTKQHPAYGNLEEMDEELHLLLRENDYHVGQKTDEEQQAAATAYTHFCEKWFTSLDWKRLKDTLRRGKADRSNGRAKRLSVSSALARKIQAMVRWDTDCDTQDDLLTKYVLPHYEELEAIGIAAEQDVVRAKLADWSPLQVAGLYWLWLKQWEALMDEKHPNIMLPPKQREHLAQVEYDPKKFAALVAEYEKQPNKYCGYAKKKWPELKEVYPLEEKGRS